MPQTSEYVRNRNTHSFLNKTLNYALSNKNTDFHNVHQFAKYGHT